MESPTLKRKLKEGVEGVYYCLGFLGGDDLVHREGQLLGMYPLCNGIAEMVPLPITRLLVRGDGVMDEGLDTLVSQKLLQRVAPFTEYRELMIDVVLVRDALGEGDERIVDMLVIIGCQLLALPIVFVQVFQLDVQHCDYSYLCRQTRIYADCHS